VWVSYANDAFESIRRVCGVRLTTAIDWSMMVSGLVNTDLADRARGSPVAKVSISEAEKQPMQRDQNMKMAKLQRLLYL
jgi:hypothetical protein